MLERRGFRMQPVGGRVGRGRDRLPDRAGLQRRARRAPAQAGGRAVPADADRDRDRRAAVPRGRPVPLHHRARRDRASTSPSSTRTRAGRSRSSAGGAGRPGRSHHRAGRARAGRNRGRGHLPPSALVSLAERVRSWDDAEKDALAEAREPAFWQSEDRHRRAEPDRVPRPPRRRDRHGGTARCAPLLGAGGPLARARSSCSPTRLHVLTAALAGLDAREASDATLTVRAGKPRTRPPAVVSCRISRAMYVGWADGRGMRIRRNGGTASSCSRSPGSAPTRCSSRRTACTCSSSRTRRTASFDRVTVLVDVGAGGGRRERAAAGPAGAGDRPALPPRALAARPQRVGDAHRPDRPRAGRRLRPLRGLRARRASRGRAG